MTIGNIGSFYDTDGVLTGSAVGFISPVGTADPADSITVFDPAIWVDPWASAGATEQGWQVNWNPTVQNINIDEQQTPVDQEMSDAVLTFVANLSEDTVQSWGFALNADKVVQAATTTLFGKTTLTPSRKLKRYKVCLETQNTGDKPTRWLVDEMTCAANVGATFKRSGARLIPVTFTSVCPLDGIQRIEITAAHT